jgi:CheY-like chemotaxis protein
MTDHLIYLVEDDEDDRQLLASIFEDFFSHCNLRYFDHGAQLMIALTHRLDGHLPELILLDLIMPVWNGFDTLRYLKNDADLKLIPTLVLTTSRQPKDIERCYELGSNAVMSKPRSYTQWVSLIGRLQTYWLEVAQTPANRLMR